MRKSAVVTKIEDPKGKEVWIACGKCNGETCHTVLTNVNRSDSWDGMDASDDYMTVQCQGCKTVSYFHQSWFSEDVRWNEETQQEENVSTDKLYPSRIVGRAEMDGIYELPHGLARVYKETHAAICNNLHILAGIGMRTIVEVVCAEKEAKGKDLKEKIDSLVTLGLTTNDGAKILHSIRLMGNKAAHEAKANTQSELGIALDVIEHLLRGVYILSERASKL
jgi:Domain of unknown function (DUF4145)